MTSLAGPQSARRRVLSPGTRALTVLLQSPVAMAIKRPIRDLVWNVKGARLTNPPLPSRVESVLFVCLGNICRSPFAAYLAEKRSGTTGRALRCSSAGLRTSQGGRSPDAACEVARTFGVALDGHRPQTLTRALVDSHDLIVAMEAAHFVELRGTYPDAAGRIVLLPLFDDAAGRGYDRFNIADPFANPRDAFETCYRRIDRALGRLFPHLHRHQD